MLHIKDIFDDVMIYIVWGVLALVFLGPFILIMVLLWPSGSPEPSPLTADVFKARFRECFEDEDEVEVVDDFVYIFETEDVDGESECFAVYYRQYKDFDTNIFLLVPDKEAEEPWMAFLHQIKNKTATQENLLMFTFYLSLDENVLRVSGGDIREA